MCKHLNGELKEFIDANHSRIINNGIMESEGNNEIGDITGYLYKCSDCLREFKYRYFPKQKFLQNIHKQFSRET